MSLLRLKTMHQGDNQWLMKGRNSSKLELGSKVHYLINKLFRGIWSTKLHERNKLKIYWMSNSSKTNYHHQESKLHYQLISTNIITKSCSHIPSLKWGFKSTSPSHLSELPMVLSNFLLKTRKSLGNKCLKTTLKKN